MATEDKVREGPLPGNVIVLFGEERHLYALKGREPRLKFPKLLNMLSYLITVATSMNIDLTGFADRIGRAFAPDTPEDKKLSPEETQKLIGDITAIMSALGNFLSGPKWEEFDRELLPFLLQEPPDSQRLDKEGDPIEVYVALFRALRYYIADGFSSSQMTALKKLFAEGERRKNSPTGETQPEMQTTQ
jgi:hypothetical protein